MLKLAAAVVLLGLAWLVGSGAAERALLYPFDPTETAPPAGLSATRLASDDGESLVVWTARPAPGKPVVLYFCGNGGNLALREARFAAFTRRGFGVVAPAYRGSSGSTGTASEATLAADAATVADALPRLVGPAPVVYYGESLGAAVALALAESRPPAALVLEAPFASVAAMAEALYGSPALARLVKSQWNSLARIAGIDVPLMILHGEDDALVPIAQGRRLFAASPSADKHFIAVSGAGHEDVWQVEAQQALYRFLDAR